MAETGFLTTLRKRWKRITILLLLASTAFFAIVGSTSTITPPEDPDDPVTIYLLMDDLHRGLWLPNADQGLIEYGFGDWDWYANNQDSWYHVFDTILWPTAGTLASRRTSARSEEELRRQFSWMQLHPIQVAAKDMQTLLESLADRFAAASNQQVYNSRYGMTFVPAGESYWFLSNCNDAVASWLESLGCSISWVPIRLDLQLAER